MATKKKPAAPENPVTQGDADAFEVNVKQWQDRLNLNDWRIERSPKASRTALAEVTRLSLKDRLAIYKIGSDFGETKPVTAQSLEEIACHEVLHVFLYELCEAMKDSRLSEDDKLAAEHRVVNTLVKLLVPEV